MKRSDQEISLRVREMVLASPRLTDIAGGSADVMKILDNIDDEWAQIGEGRVHFDVHQCPKAKATIVFQPGSGAHARNYFLLGGLLARHGYETIAVDRPGHGLSDGERGDCTVDEAIEAASAAIKLARSRSSRPVVLMGSSMGGLLTVFGLLRGLQPDLAVVHNFLYPGRLASFRLRSRWIARRRTKPYPLVKLVHNFEALSSDAAVAKYMTDRSDAYMAWELSARSVGSLFGFKAGKADHAPPTLVVTGDKDKAIPAWATRIFMRFSGLPNYEIRVVPGAGHLLFHDHLDQSVPLITQWLDARLQAA